MDNSNKTNSPRYPKPEDLVYDDKITNILNSPGITFTAESGSLLPLYIGKLPMQEVNVKVIFQLYIDRMLEGGESDIITIGAITIPMNQSEVSGMTMMADYYAEGKKVQIWINDGFVENVRIIIPTPLKIPQPIRLKLKTPDRKRRDIYEDFS